uniref:Uncharacterized protein TCIL3000_2_90 n=1 Tax=Trypanosoma congolense (strain IL3000) TaxID=1068625 RepID=G0UJ91_TRYCI|nr:unnamed protein product [Trypanosoma congolense IL3000]
MPVWSCAEGLEEIQPFLPPNKKYLIYHGAPCYERVAGGGERETSRRNRRTRMGGRVTTHVNRERNPLTEVVTERAIDWDNSDDDSSDVDLDRAKPDGPDQRQCRLYDVCMTYDQYYQTPRIFLLGYEEGK